MSHSCSARPTPLTVQKTVSEEDFIIGYFRLSDEQTCCFLSPKDPQDEDTWLKRIWGTLAGIIVVVDVNDVPVPPRYGEETVYPPNAHVVAVAKQFAVAKQCKTLGDIPVIVVCNKVDGGGSARGLLSVATVQDSVADAFGTSLRDLLYNSWHGEYPTFRYLSAGMSLLAYQARRYSVPFDEFARVSPELLYAMGKMTIGHHGWVHLGSENNKKARLYAALQEVGQNDFYLEGKESFAAFREVFDHVILTHGRRKNKRASDALVNYPP
jgi:hypothetical protein